MSERAQTGIDFLIGMSVFLLAVAFTFGFVPSMIEPFSDNAGSNLQIADRSAAHLAENALGSNEQDDAPQRPGVLNESSVSDFFEKPDLQAELGLSDHTQANITIEADGEMAEYRAGPEPPSNVNVAVSTRIVSINGIEAGDQYELSVRVW